MTSFEDTLIEFSVSIDLDKVSDTIFDSSKAMVDIINKTNKVDINKIALFEEYLSGISKGLSIGSMNNLKGNDILIIRYINDGIISKFKNKQISGENAWSFLSDLLD